MAQVIAWLDDGPSNHRGVVDAMCSDECERQLSPASSQRPRRESGKGESENDAGKPS
jgi:hypothetical protein